MYNKIFSNYFIMNNHNYEMATSINSLQHPQINNIDNHNNNVNNLVRNVENNIETLNNTRNIQPSQPAPINYKPQLNTEQPQSGFTYNPNRNINTNIVNKEMPIKTVTSRKKPWYKRILVNTKEHLIIILLFSLLAHKKVNKLLLNYVPYLDNLETPIPSLLIRGILLTVLLFIIKTFI